MSQLTKKEALESALLKLFQEQPFYGTLLQQINIRYNEQIPTACIKYDKKKDNFVMDLNYEYFATKPVLERKAILCHEILHFSHQHIWRWMGLRNNTESPDQNDQFLFNMAADMAINQYINNKPTGWVDVTLFKTKNGIPFPTYRTMEEYYSLLQDYDGKKAKSKAKEGKGKDKNKGTPKYEGKTPNQDQLERYQSPQGEGERDQHDWEDMSEEDKQKLLEEAKKLIQRTMEKTCYSASQLPGHIQDLLEKLEAEIAGINYKRIIKETIKRSIACADRENTWNRPSKRYGIYSPGTKVGKIPNISFFADTSGSISYTEMSEFLKTCDEFLKIGQKKCNLGLWHTNLYKVLKYRNHTSFEQGDIESGGTDVKNTLEYIELKRPDLAIILTDGYLDGGNNYRTDCNILWVISKNGTTEHPYKHVGKTVQIK